MFLTPTLIPKTLEQLGEQKVSLAETIRLREETYNCQVKVYWNSQRHHSEAPMAIIRCIPLERNVSACCLCSNTSKYTSHESSDIAWACHPLQMEAVHAHMKDVPALGQGLTDPEGSAEEDNNEYDEADESKHYQHPLSSLLSLYKSCTIHMTMLLGKTRKETFWMMWCAWLQIAYSGNSPITSLHLNQVLKLMQHREFFQKGGWWHVEWNIIHSFSAQFHSHLAPCSTSFCSQSLENLLDWICVQCQKVTMRCQKRSQRSWVSRKAKILLLILYVLVFTC